MSRTFTETRPTRRRDSACLAALAHVSFASQAQAKLTLMDVVVEQIPLSATAGSFTDIRPPCSDGMHYQLAAGQLATTTVPRSELGHSRPFAQLSSSPAFLYTWHSRVLGVLALPYPPRPRKGFLLISWIKLCRWFSTASSGPVVGPRYHVHPRD